MRMKRIASILLIVVMLSAAGPAAAASQPAAKETGTPQFSGKPGAFNRIVFAIDCSGSMNQSDANRLTKELIKMFIDTADPNRTEVGLLAFNAGIVSSSLLMPIAQEADRSYLKSQVDKIRNSGGTNIEAALAYAMAMLEEAPAQENSRLAVILLSDGDTDTRYAQAGQTLSESQASETAAFEKAKELGASVYAVGISKDSSFNTQYLKRIAENTNGKQYELRNTGEWMSLFGQLLADVADAEAAADQTVAGTGAMQSVTVNIPYEHNAESNIIIQHNGALRGAALQGAGGSAFTFVSARYAGFKIPKPTAQSVTISFTAARGDQVKINTVNYFDVLPVLAMPENPAALHVPLEAKLYDLNQNAALSGKAPYEGLTAELLAVDPVTGQTKAFPMENTGEGFAAVYPNTSPKLTDLKVKVSKAAQYTAWSARVETAFTNTVPVQTDTLGSQVLKQGKAQEYDLNKFFKDADGDGLSYELTGYGGELGVKVSGSLFTFTPEKEGKEDIFILVSDGRGGVLAGNFAFEVVPFFVYYRGVYIAVGMIVIAAALACLMLMRRTKRVPQAAPVILSNNVKFSAARFEGYFLSTFSGNDIPVLNWNASYIENKHMISLGEMFNMMDVTERLPEAHKIFFEAGHGGSVLFHHNSECVVTLGRQDVPPGKRELLKFDDKLYILFQDHETEIEVRYKRARKVPKV